MKKTVFAIILALVMVFAAGCANYEFDETGNYIVTAEEALKLADEGAILVDAASADDYAGGHVSGAVNIPMSALVVNEPYKNMLPEAKQVGDVMGAAGITENDTILVYDNANNMEAARVQWTLNMYNNFNVKVVGGGIGALTKAGASIVTEATALPEATYAAGDKQKKLVVKLNYINVLLDKDEEGTVIIDTRSAEEYNEGTIPGACHIEYVWNNYGSGDYKSPRDLQSTYIGKGILPDMKLIVFCKTSVRAAQTYTALKDAGYKDVRVYDGAWLEYSDVEGAPEPTETIVPSVQDAS